MDTRVPENTEEAKTPLTDSLQPTARKGWTERAADWLGTPSGMATTVALMVGAAGGKQLYTHHQLAGHKPVEAADNMPDRLQAAQEFTDMMNQEKYRVAMYNFMHNKEKKRPAHLPVTEFEREVYSNLKDLAQAIERAGIKQFETFIQAGGKKVTIVHSTLELQNYLGRNNPDRFSKEQSSGVGISR